MITLTNRAKVHAAFLLPAGGGLKPHGLVLAEQGNCWVTWEVYCDTEGVDGFHTPAQWEAEQGHYFQKSMTLEQGNPRALAEFDFGFRLKWLLNVHQLSGIRITSQVEGG